MAKPLTREEEVAQLKTALNALRQPVIDLASVHRVYGHVQVIALLMLATEAGRVLGIPRHVLTKSLEDFYAEPPINVTTVDLTHVGQA